MKQFADRAFLALLLAVLLAVPLGVALWSHKETTAYYENRSLAEAPELTAESVWDGSFGTEAESWYSDHAPGRTTLLELDTWVQMKLMGRPVVNGIVTVGDVLLPELEFDEYSEEAYRYGAAPIAEDFGALSAYVESLGSTFCYVGFPEQRVYFEDRFPDYLNNHSREAATADAVFAEALAEQGVDFLNMREVYDQQGNPAEYYSAVDHHYRYWGTYAAYRAILDHLSEQGWDLPVLTEEDLEFQSLPYPYIGSRNRKLYNLWPNEEQAVIAVQKDPVAFTRWDNGAPSDKPLFVLPVSEELPTTYNLYMGGDFGETILDTDRPELPNVLVFGDSFTNALETLLYASFNEMHSLDLRYYTEQSLKDYIAAYQPDIVLCVQNDTFYYTEGGNNAVWVD